MHKIYYIDSENVGDNWVSLLNTVAPEDEILVFYTAKSPHMNYKNIVLLKQSQKEVTFIECCEGNNALDFQLCTDLGYRIHEMADNEFIIVSNDTGYDAVVKYWRRRNIFVKRIPGKACSTLISIMPDPALPVVTNRVPDSGTAPSSATTPFSATPTVSTMHQASTDSSSLSDAFDFADITVDKGTTASAVSTEAAEDSTASAASVKDAEDSTTSAASTEDAEGSTASAASTKDAEGSTTSATSTEAAEDSSASVASVKDVEGSTASAASTEAAAKPKNTSNVMDVRAKEILYILGKENLQDLHEALQQLFGSKKGQSYYNSFKSDNSFNNYISKHQKMSSVEKQNSYCSIVFDLSDTKLDMPDDFSSFVADTWKKKKNLNSFRASLQSKYGKDKSDKYYSLIKAHVKILDKIK